MTGISNVSSPIPLDRAPSRAKVGLTGVALAALLALGACASDPGPKQTAGTIVGAVAGGLAGSTIGGGSGRIVAIGIGSLLGAYVGSEVGRSMDRADQRYAARTAQYSLEHKPAGSTSTWVNPDNGHSGTVTPRRSFESRSGRYCREYQTTVTIDGRTQSAFGAACRERDGSWQIRNG